MPAMINIWRLTTDCGAKLRQFEGESQGKGGREVRIYTIKNNVKYLTKISGQKSLVSLLRLTSDI